MSLHFPLKLHLGIILPALQRSPHGPAQDAGLPGNLPSCHPRLSKDSPPTLPSHAYPPYPLLLSFHPISHRNYMTRPLAPHTGSQTGQLLCHPLQCTLLHLKLLHPFYSPPLDYYHLYKKRIACSNILHPLRFRFSRISFYHRTS